LPLVGDVLGQHRQQGLPLASAVGHAFGDAPFALVEPAQVRVPDRAGGHPLAPAFGFGGQPGLQVQIEGADGQERAFDVQAGLAVAADEQPLFSLLDSLFAQAQVGLTGLMSPTTFQKYCTRFRTSLSSVE
jgi:hypothetical protein